MYGRNVHEIIAGKGTRITDIQLPKVAGTHSEHVLNRWSHHDTLYFIVLRAVSHIGLPGPWTMPTRLYMPSPATTTEINTRGSTQASATNGNVGNLEASRRKFLSTRDLLAIVGVACGFLLIVLILSVYYVVVVTKRRRRQERKTRTTDQVTPPEPECETDSINKQPDKDLVLTETAKEPRPLSPVQSWPASRLLNEHERRRPPDAQGECLNPPPDIGVSTNPHPFLYHTMNGRYIEDNIPFDGGSLVSTQPSDSMLVYRLDTGATETARPPSSTEWDPNLRQGIVIPNMQPPQQQSHPQQHIDHHSSTTLPHDRRRRNVTQV